MKDNPLNADFGEDLNLALKLVREMLPMVLSMMVEGKPRVRKKEDIDLYESFIIKEIKGFGEWNWVLTGNRVGKSFVRIVLVIYRLIKDVYLYRIHSDEMK